MEQRVIEKNKYIIYNEENKILAFLRETSRGNQQIFIPGINLTSLFNIDDSLSQFQQNIVNILVNEEDLVLIGKNEYDIDAFQAVNGKLKKSPVQKLLLLFS